MRGLRARLGDPEVRRASQRFTENVRPGLARLAELIERAAA
jgi:hypothetical protein